MGRVFKKNVNKRPIHEVKEEEAPVLKKKKEEEELPVEEEEDSEEEEDEDEIEDEELDGEIDDEEQEEDEEEEDEDLDDEETEKKEKDILDFDFEGFPMEEGDRDGISNMLTQVFLRADIDVRTMAEKFIEQAPYGSVVGPADEDADEDDKNVVYGVCSTIPINTKEQPKYAKNILNYLLVRAKKSAPKEVVKKIEEVFEGDDGSTAFFVNERMLNFPSLIVPQIFGSLKNDVGSLEKKFENIVYIQKIRVAEGSGKPEENGQGTSKPKRKMGKAEKKRLAAATLAQSNIEFDNPEDKTLFEISAGKEVHFDFPVHMDVEPGSKFHIVEKDGQKWNPFRRLVIMDSKRFEEFLQRGKDGQF